MQNVQTSCPFISMDNARSLRHKIDLLECELKEHDIVTVSETWLTEDITNDEVHIGGFHPPIRERQ